MVEWIDYSQNIPLSKVRQEHSAIKDSGEFLNTVLAVGVAGHFPSDSCNAMLLPLHQLTLALNFIILEFSFGSSEIWSEKLCIKRRKPLDIYYI